MTLRGTSVLVVLGRLLRFYVGNPFEIGNDLLRVLGVRENLVTIDMISPKDFGLRMGSFELTSTDE